MKNQVKILGVTLKRNELKNVEGAVSGTSCDSGYVPCGMQGACCDISTSACQTVNGQRVCVSILKG
ncbi:MAG: hypothetical protein QM528_03615 [Phycisphaerales bacterium]|nr:hypothetical protein [Phycisphaerales bacterium]